MSDSSRLFRTTEEQLIPLQATVKGCIPDWLNGYYIRVGPGIFDAGDFTVNHWCDGFAVVYKFQIQKGKVTFSKRIVQSDAYKKFISGKRPVFTEFGTKAYTDKNKNIFQKMISNMVPQLTDNVAGNIFKMGDTIYLATETCNLRILDTEDLTADKKIDLSQYIDINNFCSHVITDHDGTSYAFGAALSSNFKPKVIKIPSCLSPNEEFKTAECLCMIPNRISSLSSYSHSFGQTEHYIVFIEQPLFLSSMKMITSYIKGRTFHECMKWDPQESTRFILINKSNGSILPITYESDHPFFFLHFINCYEKNNEVIIDVVCHDGPEILDWLYLKHLRKSNFENKDQGACRRYVLPIGQKIEEFPDNQNLIKTDQRVTAVKKNDKLIISGFKITEPNYDFPKINPDYAGKEYNYFYASGLFGWSKYRGCVLKVDVRSGEVLTWRDGSGDAIPGEVAFVSRPTPAGEDDGLLLAPVTQASPTGGEKDFLVILDARNLEELARAEVDAHVPHLTHAIFLPKSS